MSTQYKLVGTGPVDSPADLDLAVTGANTYYSDPVSVPDGAAVSFSVRFSGTPTGTLTLWYSNKPNADRTSDTDWIQDSTFSPTNPAGAAIKNLYTVGNLTVKYARLKYVNSASSGGWNVKASVGTQR